MRRRLQILNPQSRYTKEGRGTAGHFLATSQDPDPPIFTDYGDSVQATVLSLTPKAVCVPFPYNKPIVATNPSSKLFRAIVSRSNQRDTGCAFGFEVVLRANFEELVFFCGTIQLRNLLPDFQACINRRIILATSLVESKRFQWYTAEIFVPFRHTAGFRKEPVYSDDYDDTLD